MSVALNELLASIPADHWHDAPPRPPAMVVDGLCHDSRQALPGDLFFALPGARFDGARFVPDALRRGAVAAVVEREAEVAAGVPILRARSARRVLGLCAALFHRQPSRRMRVTAVTGTDGKTSSVWFTRHILEHCGHRVVALGTLGVLEMNGTVRGWVAGGTPASALAGRAAPPETTREAVSDQEAARTWQPTTPEAPLFHATLAQLADGGIEDVVCEVSSHALAQERVYGTQFRAVALTHVAVDHLDFHGTPQAYRAAKARLFARETRGGPLEEAAVLHVLNLDDDLGRELAAQAGGPLVTYGAPREARVRCLAAESATTGIRLRVAFEGVAIDLVTPVYGQYHVANLLTAVAIGYGLGLSPAEMAAALRAAPPVPGRFEVVRAGQPFTILVDYAHTVDGLRSLLQAARGLGDGTLIVVFGCGGDRDRSKREIMGRIAGELAQRVIVTSDNPRSEDPAAIAAQVARGLEGSAANWEIVLDRRAALARAVAIAGPRDILVAAGKGAETLQIHADRVERFDDREVLREVVQT